MRRLVQLLAALCIAVGSVSMPVAAGAAESARVSCCGASCTCGDQCPCLAESDEDTPAPVGPGAPRAQDERRILGVSPIPSGTVPVTVAAVPCAPLALRDLRAPSAPAGRALLERISLWTT